MRNNQRLVTAALAASVLNTLLLSSVCVAAILALSKSRRLEVKANLMQAEAERLARAAERELDDGGDDRDSEERRRRVRDNIRKLIDLLTNADPRI